MQISIDKQTKKPKISTRIIFLLDRSISMMSMKEEAVAGFNQYLEAQKKIKGKANISLFFFDSSFQPVFESIDIKKAPMIHNEAANTSLDPHLEYKPQGMTSLYDYIHDTIMRFKDTAKKNEKTIFAILTDGDDTSSKNHNYHTVQATIKEVQDANGWEILFLGANLNAKQFASSIGIKLSNVAQFSASKKGISDAIDTIAVASSYYRDDTATVNRVRAVGASLGKDIDVSSLHAAVSGDKLKK